MAAHRALSIGEIFPKSSAGGLRSCYRRQSPASFMPLAFGASPAAFVANIVTRLTELSWGELEPVSWARPGPHWYLCGKCSLQSWFFDRFWTGFGPVLDRFEISLPRSFRKRFEGGNVSIVVLKFQRIDLLSISYF